ncbi:ClpXP protease specificity-enhancing factor [Roseateles amylovorans]|jgi:stringent starvation protein B|uniref:ClpXP protease specificity-enhancing factor n=1 Tax=Roseateles amylovorans TaxID=2978473 RepID=A0ABY6B484_9BURK|nr:ClpXP protease specificity-enhancing factor [Roseateles amylovorans]UXH79744.1 ClpXP protease specificity-enhancing factor [Roseateles amylovorans]
MDDSKDGGTAASSTRPYLVRALHEWCTDNGFTPYIAVHVDRSVQVPLEYVSNNEIVLNVGFEATSNLDLGNETIQFKARFGGVAREIIVPIDHVVAIYARENGQGMAFPPPSPDEAAPHQRPAAVPGAAPRGLRLASGSDSEAPAAKPEEPATPVVSGDGDDDPGGAPSGGRPALKRIK